MWIWKISTFSPDLAVTGGEGLSKWLFVHQSACFMNVLQWTVFVSLLEGKKKKKNCPRISKAKQRPSPTEFSILSIRRGSDQHVYQSAYQVGWNLNALPNVGKGICRSILLLPVIISFVIIYHRGNLFSVFLGEVRGGSFAPDGICMTGLKFLNVMPGFRLYHSPNANTTLRPMLPPHHTDPAGSRLRLDSGLDVCRDVKCNGDCHVTRIRIAQYCNLFNKKTLFNSLTVSCFRETFWHDYCITPLLRSNSIVNEFISEHILLRRRANCLKVSICQHRSAVVMSWLCQNDLLYRFFFSFLWVYTCCCISKEEFWR